MFHRMFRRMLLRMFCADELALSLKAKSATDAFALEVMHSDSNTISDVSLNGSTISMMTRDGRAVIDILAWESASATRQAITI